MIGSASSQTERSLACRACGSRTVRATHAVPEMLLRSGSEFSYTECGTCGSLTLGDRPDVEPFYPPSYFRHAEELVAARSRRVVRAIRGLFDRVAPVVSPLTGSWGLGLRARTAASSRILDVGCGKGHFLKRLRDLGMTDLTGVDPYGTFEDGSENARSRCPRLIRGSIEDVHGTFDIIVFNHSLEHVEEPVAVLCAARTRLSDGGRIVVRIPVIGYAWRRYGRHWVQLDAPRHMTIFSQRGIRECAARAGLAIEQVTYDSTAFQFWGSEEYARGVYPSVDARAVTFRAALRSAGHIVSGMQALRLNARHDGDQAAYVMRPPAAGS